MKLGVQCGWMRWCCSCCGPCCVVLFRRFRPLVVLCCGNGDVKGVDWACPGLDIRQDTESSWQAGLDFFGSTMFRQDRSELGRDRVTPAGQQRTENAWSNNGGGRCTLVCGMGVDKHKHKHSHPASTYVGIFLFVCSIHPAGDLASAGWLLSLAP